MIDFSYTRYRKFQFMINLFQKEPEWWRQFEVIKNLLENHTLRVSFSLSTVFTLEISHIHTNTLERERGRQFNRLSGRVLILKLCVKMKPRQLNFHIN